MNSLLALKDDQFTSAESALNALQSQQNPLGFAEQPHSPREASYGSYARARQGLTHSVRGTAGGEDRPSRLYRVSDDTYYCSTCPFCL